MAGNLKQVSLFLYITKAVDMVNLNSKPRLLFCCSSIQECYGMIAESSLMQKISTADETSSVDY